MKAAQKKGVVAIIIFYNHKKLVLSNLHYGPQYEPHYRTQGCVIREYNLTAPITNPIEDTLVLLRTNSNANGSVKCRTSVYSNLFHWPMGKNSGNQNGACKYIPAVVLEDDIFYKFATVQWP